MRNPRRRGYSTWRAINFSSTAELSRCLLTASEILHRYELKAAPCGEALRSCGRAKQKPRSLLIGQSGTRLKQKRPPRSRVRRGDSGTRELIWSTTRAGELSAKERHAFSSAQYPAGFHRPKSNGDGPAITSFSFDSNAEKKRKDTKRSLMHHHGHARSRPRSTHKRSPASPKSQISNLHPSPSLASEATL